MCIKVVINLGEKEIETPRQFLDHFGFMPEVVGNFNAKYEMDECLCSCHLSTTFNKHKIPFKYDGDFYVGKLEDYKECS